MVAGDDGTSDDLPGPFKLKSESSLIRFGGSFMEEKGKKEIDLCQVKCVLQNMYSYLPFFSDPFCLLDHLNQNKFQQ